MAMESVLDLPDVVQLMGINLHRAQLTAFAVGHFYAEIEGALYGWHLQFVATEAFSLMRSIEMLVLIIIGGLGSLAGAFLVPDSTWRFRRWLTSPATGSLLTYRLLDRSHLVFFGLLLYSF